MQLGRTRTSGWPACSRTDAARVSVVTVTMSQARMFAAIAARTSGRMYLAYASSMARGMLK